MTTTMHRLDELAARLAEGGECSRADAALVAAETDLVRIGVLGEDARRRVTAETVTFGRVALAGPSLEGFDVGAAGDIRLVGAPASIDEALARVRDVAARAQGVVVTGFSLVDLLEWAGHDHLRLAEHAHALRAEGLEALAEVPVDRLGAADQIIELLRAVHHGGLSTWRLTVDAAPLASRLELIERAADVQRQTGAIRAFAPLPRLDPADVPSSGYDDVRTVAVARLRCANIERIQVDWPLYGPKLAQVALAYGAGDVDGVAAVDTPDVGARRASGVDIARQIRAVGATPVERDGRYQVRT